MDNSPDSETDAQPKRMISSNELDSIQKDLKAAIQNHAALGIKAKQFPDDKSIRVELDGLAEKIMVLNDKQKEVVNKIRQLSNATKQNKQEAPAILSKVSIMSRRPNVSRSPSILSPAKSPNRNLPSPKVQIASNFPAQHKPRKSELKPRCHSPPIKVPSFQPSTPPSPATPPINRSPSITPSKKAKMYNAPKVRSVEKRTSPPPDNTMEHEEPVYPFSNGWLSSEKNPEKSAELQFMWSLKLVPIAQAEEMRKRRSERKRRSTANPQFSYSNSAGGDLSDRRPKSSSFYHTLSSRMRSLEDEKSSLTDSIEKSRTNVRNMKTNSENKKKKADELVSINKSNQVKLKKLEQYLLAIQQLVPSPSPPSE